MKSSHQMCLELLEQTLHSASSFQMQAAKHRALVIRDALNADKDVCEALLRKIDQLNSCIVPSRQAGTRLLTLAGSEARALVGPSAKTAIASE
jgi:hypothetical protein